MIGAIIPARGGSKGIPGKNIRPIGGQPLIVHTIKAALGSHHIDRVAVSTDDPMIAEVATAAGAEIIWRPDDLSGDLASSESALLHAIAEWDKQGFVPEYLVFLQCTSPMTRAQDLDGLIQHVIDENADSSFTGTINHRYVWSEGPDGDWGGVNHDKAVRERRQDRRKEIVENGAAYCMKLSGFLQAKHRFFGRTICWELPETHSVELDEPIDLVMAGILFEEARKSAVAECLPKRTDAIVFDFDGVFTRNTVYLNETGEESVRCSRGDGMAISHFRKQHDIRLLVLSTEKNLVVVKRCEKLGLECIYGASPKENVLKKWLAENGLNPANVVFVGNDYNDMESMKLVGCPVAVADALPEVKSHAKILLRRRGGEDAVRELLNLYGKPSVEFY
jgi:N-acylneuraminate cytidylyltransferase